MRYGRYFFDTGRIRAQIRAADARDAAGLARYEQTVLQTLAETETALSRLRREKEQVERLEASAGSNRDAVPALGTDVVALYKALGGGWEHIGEAFS